jgi:hypothetical protein
MYFVVPLDVEETDGKESPWLAQNDEEQVEAQESRTLRSRCKRKSDTLSSPPCAAAEQVAFPQVLVVLNIASCGWGPLLENKTRIKIKARNQRRCATLKLSTQPTCGVMQKLSSRVGSSLVTNSYSKMAHPSISLHAELEGDGQQEEQSSCRATSSIAIVTIWRNRY